MNQCTRIAAIALILLGSLLAFASGGKQKNFNTRGFVLEMDSVSKFDLDDYEVHCTAATRVAIPLPDGTRAVAGCRPEAIRLGAELEVTGDYDPKTQQIEAQEIVVQPQDAKVNGTALIERAPSLQRAGAGWTGTIFADGRRLAISPETEVRFTSSTDKSAKSESKGIDSLDAVGANVWVAYSGTMASDGAVKVERLAVSANNVSKKEQKFRTKYDAVVVEPDYAARKAGEVAVKNLKPFTIVPDRAVQDYISRVGHSVVPEFQRSMADGDERKIRFRFYVVEGMNHGVVHTADGSVFVSVETLDRLTNEAQFAGVLAADVAGIVQEQDFRLYSNAEWSRALSWSSAGAGFLPMGLGLPIQALSVANGIGMKRQLNVLNQQAGRLGMEYAAAAGYDPRDVRTAYKTLSKKSDSGVKMKAQERAYYAAAAQEATSELATAFRGVDLSKMKTDEGSYKAFVEQVKKAR